MKRSKFIRLGVMSASVIVLSACGEDEQKIKANVYENPAQCEANAVTPGAKEDCQSQFLAAKTTHETQAPRYTDKAQCEQEFGTGNCETRSSAGADGGGSSFFIPMMMGYMMGSMMNSGGNTYVTNNNDGDKDKDRRQTATGAVAARSYVSTPLYRPFAGGAPGAFSTPNGASLGTSSTGSVATTSSAFKAAPSATVVSRGGFAARSAGFAAS